MDFLNLLARLADLDTPTLPAAAPRRTALSQLGKAGTALLPALLTGLALPAAAAAAAPQDTRTRLDALRLALQLELLENEFYSRALGLVTGFSAVPFSATEKTALQTIQRHEAQHVTLFQRLITDAGSALEPAARYDFTGSKNGTQPALYPDIQTNPDTFLQVAQLLEDAGVRAYKGQVEFLQTDAYMLEAALRTHSTEARHASHIRTMRRQRGASVKSWVSPADASITTPGSGAAKVYEGEDNATQYVNIGTILTKVPFDSTLPINVGTPALTAAQILAKVAEAFDEPVNAITATALLQLFTY
ncbi:ferritin-like domain-containing protein [Hymenobacter rubripertinctus]|uniref:Ferritin-like domain-containing protein n=1 Tax=Hymenobacter rubripertinctus TaxID=2029981 RepID=A0A418QKG7_9BACT|nr:ferritin-like domain-containing protein [Hymenobacter rubripertinctus]RIY05717.1 ferritin-like domain-containing protein [Hymenobacter rubripertinctus]